MQEIDFTDSIFTIIRFTKVTSFTRNNQLQEEFRVKFAFHYPLFNF